MQQVKALHNESATNKGYLSVLFFLSPILAVVLAAKNYRETWTKNIIWAFAVFYGLTFVIGNEGSDVNRYKERFELIVVENLGPIEFVQSMIKEGSSDFLQPIISYAVSLITNDFRYVLAFFGFIFGYFFSRNIWAVLSFAQGKLKWYSIMFIIIFSFIYAVWDINVLRFTIAAHMFFYAAFRIIVNNNKKAWLVLLLAPLMHFTFVLPIAVLIAYRFIGNRTTAFFILYLVSFMVGELNLEAFKSSLSFLPAAYQENSEDYLNEDYKERREQIKEQKNFRGKFYQLSLKIATTILLWIIYFNRKRWLVQEKAWYNCFSFTLLFLGIFNILTMIPVMNRFLFVGYLFALALFFVYFQRSIPKEELAVRIAPLLLLFFFIVKFRIGFEFTGLFTVLGGPITAFFNEGDVALINFLK